MAILSLYRLYALGVTVAISHCFTVAIVKPVSVTKKKKLILYTETKQRITHNMLIFQDYKNETDREFY